MLDEVHVQHLEALRALDAAVTSQGLQLGSHHVMFFAEAELMRLHARALVDGVARPDVLEVGIGLGVFAAQLATVGVGSYTAVEAHPQVADIAKARVLSSYPAPTELVIAPWQLATFPPDSFDAIMYDTWPPDGCADSDFAILSRRWLCAVCDQAAGSAFSAAARPSAAGAGKSWNAISPRSRPGLTPLRQRTFRRVGRSPPLISSFRSPPRLGDHERVI